MSHTLAYGDIIRIYCSLQDTMDAKTKIGGFLMSKGFADTNIYFLKSQKFTEFELRNSLFQILPYSSFEIHDEAKKKKEEAKNNKDLKSEPETENTKSSKKTELEQFKSKIAKERKMEIGFDSEVVIKHVNSDAYLQGEFSCPETGIGSFKVILSDELSSDVKFKMTRFRNSDKQSEKIQSKDQFILYHCTSHCYLNIGDIHQKVFLDKQIKIQSDPNTIENPKELAKQDNEAYKFVNQRPIIKQPNQGNQKFIQRHEVVNMSKPTLILKFLLEKSSKQEVSESQIQHNDVIYIRNTQNMSYLTADLWSGDVKLVSYLGDRAGEFPYEGIWEVSIPRDSERGQFDTIEKYFLKHYITDRTCKVEKMEKVESDGIDELGRNDMKDENDEEEDPRISSKLKGLKLLSKMPNPGEKQKLQVFDTFKITNYNQKKTLKHRDLVFLEVCKSRKEGNTIIEYPGSQKYKDENRPKEYLDIGNKTEKNYRTKLEDECAKNTQNYNLELTEGPLINAFQIFKLEEKKLKQINTLLSTVEILTNFCDVLIVLENQFRKEIKNKRAERPNTSNSFYQNNNHESLHNTSLQNRGSKNSFSDIKPSDQVEPPLQKFSNEYLNYYILNLVITTIMYLLKNITKKNKKLDFAFMMMIKSLGLIEILIEAIFFIERTNEMAEQAQKHTDFKSFKNKKYRKDRLDECFKQIYCLLIKLSEENSCKLYLGRWFDMFVRQFYLLKKDFIHTLIIELLKEKFIIKTLRPSDIEKCIENISSINVQEGAFKYLELLSSFCRTKNTAIPSNQNLVINQLKKHPQIFYTFIIEEGKGQSTSWKKKLHHYKKDISQKEIVDKKNEEKQKYFIYLLNLYADLIFDRSSKEISVIEEFIKMETVKVFFVNKDEGENVFDSGIIDPFLKLTHYFFQSRLKTRDIKAKIMDRETTLHKKDESKTQQGESHSDLFQDYKKIIQFIRVDILEKQKNEKDYSIPVLKIIETSLDFIRTVAKIDDSELMDNILRLIISEVLKLKVSLIYKSAAGKINELYNLCHNLDENTSQEEKEESKIDIINSIDKKIAVNIQKLLSEKKMERLLIDTRSISGEILDSKINKLMNNSLKEMNSLFIKVCNNEISIEEYSWTGQDETFVFGQNNHWIWINMIRKIVDQEINQKLNNLVVNKEENQDQEMNLAGGFNNAYEYDEELAGKKVLVKLLIECIFVDSLKIVNKIVLLIFKLYELRKTLMYRFKDSFLIENDDFNNISEFIINWISDFQKTKLTEQSRKNNLIKSLQILSFRMRYYEDPAKIAQLMENYGSLMHRSEYPAKQPIKNRGRLLQNPWIKEVKEDKYDENYEMLREGLSNYIVLDETETNFSINQVLLQKMIGNQKIHTYIISYIDGLKEESMHYDSHLSIAYQFLTLLVYNNTKNKKILTKHIKTVLKHITANYKAIEFMKKLIIENQNIINNRELVSKIVKCIVEGAHSVHGDEEKLMIKAKLIESLRVFCVLEGKSHPQNQALIMIQLQNKEYQNTLMFSTIEYRINKNIRKEDKSGIVDIIEQMLTAGENHHIRNLSLSSQELFDDYYRESEDSIGDFKKYPQLLQELYEFRESYKNLVEGQDDGVVRQQKEGEEEEGKQGEGRQHSQHRKERTISISGNIMYLVAYFSTMSALVEGNHEVNKGKCCNIHPYESLVELSKDCSKCWPLVRHLRAYMIKLYCSNISEKKDTNYMTIGASLNPSVQNSSSSKHVSRADIQQYDNLLTMFLDKEMQILIERTKYINSDLLYSHSTIFQVKISTPIRYQYMGSYIFCSLLEILYEIHIFFTKIADHPLTKESKKRRNLNKEESDKLKELIMLVGETYQLTSKLNKENSIRRILEEILKKSLHVVELASSNEESQLEFLNNIEETNKINYVIESHPFLKSQTTKLTSALHSKFVIYAFFLSNEESRQNLVTSSSSYQQFNSDKKTSSEGNIIKSYLRKLIPIPIKEKPKDPKDNYQESMKRADLIYQDLETKHKDIRVNRLLEIISEDLVDREESQKIIKEEMDGLVELCCNLDETRSIIQAKGKEEYRVVGFKMFMESIIHLVTKSPPHLTLEGKIKTIRLIRLIFEEKVMTACGFKDNKNKEWESGMFQDSNLKKLSKIQKEFKELKLNQMIVAILKSQVQSYELLSQTFKLGVRFLYNGNSECQLAILKNLQEDPENMVMVQLYNFIKKTRLEISQGKFVIKSTSTGEKVAAENNFSDSMVDTFHHFDMKNRMMCQLGAQRDNSKEFEQEILLKIQCVCEAYQFLQLMCENDNQTCKNFLREQTNENQVMKYNSINFVSETAKLFKVVLDNFDSQSKHYSILQYLADFFIEVSQLPCIKNQLQLCSTSIFSNIRNINSVNKEKQKEKSQDTMKTGNAAKDKDRNAASSLTKFQQHAGSGKPMCYLYDFVINAGLSLLEGGSKEIYESLIATLKGDFIYEIFKYQELVLKILNTKNPQCPQIHDFKDETLKILLTTDSENADIRKRIHMVYNLFALVEKISKYMREKNQECFMYQSTLYNDLVKAVEQGDNKLQQTNRDLITIQEFPKKLKHIEVVFQNKNQYLYFPDLPIFKQLSEETKVEVVENIKRDTQIDKITDFLVKSSEINNLMDWNFKVEDRESLKTQDLDSIRLHILALTTIIVSLYILFTSVVFVEVKGKMQMLKTIDNPIINGIVNILCVFHLFFSVYFVFIWCTLKYRMPIERELKEKGDDKIKQLLSKIDNDKRLEYKDILSCVELMFKNQSQIYSILFFFILFSFMGYFVGLEWYSMLIFDIVTREKILKNVIQAITSNLRQLLVVSLLILAFVYVFNMISIQYNLYLPLIYENEDDKCTILSDCVISLYTSGEIGEKHKDFKFTKFLADLLYIVIMELLFSNIVSGIVIDTFAQLRDQRKTIESDNKTKCFICGISKGTLEKQLREKDDSSLKPEGKLKFQYHTSTVHNQWHYIYYLYILSKKDITTYTGIEYYIKKQCSDDQYDWIPIYEEDDDRDVKEILSTTQRLIPRIKQRLNESQKALM